MHAGSRRPRRRGWTLVELVVMITVAGLTLPYLAWVFARMAETSARPDLQTVAANLAREKLEILAADKFNASRGYAYLAAANYPAESPVSDSTMTRSVAFTDVSAADLSTAQSGSGCRKAVVTVTWAGGAQSLALSMVFTLH